MIGDMARDRAQSSAIKLPDLFLPVAPASRRTTETAVRTIFHAAASNAGAAPKAARKISRCSSGSLGFPAGQPSGKSRNTVRGGLKATLTSQSVLIESVGKPRASRARAISPTDR